MEIKEATSLSVYDLKRMKDKLYVVGRFTTSEQVYHALAFASEIGFAGTQPQFQLNFNKTFTYDYPGGPEGGKQAEAHQVMSLDENGLTLSGVVFTSTGDCAAILNLKL